MRKQSSSPIYRRETERKDEKMKEQNPPAPAGSMIRLYDVLKLVPVSKSTIWHWVREKKFPQPVKLGERTTAWRHSDVLAFLEKAGG